MELMTSQDPRGRVELMTSQDPRGRVELMTSQDPRGRVEQRFRRWRVLWRDIPVRSLTLLMETRGRERTEDSPWACPRGLCVELKILLHLVLVLRIELLSRAELTEEPRTETGQGGSLSTWHRGHCVSHRK